MDGGPPVRVGGGVVAYTGRADWGIDDEILIPITFNGVSRVNVSDGTSTLLEERAGFASYLPDGMTMLLSNSSDPISVMGPGARQPYCCRKWHRRSNAESGKACVDGARD